jgi:hypothetical protein
MSVTSDDSFLRRSHSIGIFNLPVRCFVLNPQSWLICESLSISQPRREDVAAHALAEKRAREGRCAY